jgi:hypothetical protein
MIATPIGINIAPTTVKQLITHFGVKIGCHAGSFCCLNFDSEGRRDPPAAAVAGGIVRPSGQNKSKHILRRTTISMSTQKSFQVKLDGS